MSDDRPTEATPPPAAPAGSTPPRGLFDRVKNILVAPAAEWPVIDGEATSIGRLITGYAMILAAIAPIAILIGMFLTPFGSLIGIGFLIKLLLVVYAVSLGTVVLLGFVVDLLAPALGGTKNGVQAMKLAVYSGTPFWIAALILILPDLWFLWLVLGVGYGGFLVWLGLPILMRVPADKAPAYVGAVVGIWVVLFVILWQIAWRIIWSGMIYGMM